MAEPTPLSADFPYESRFVEVHGSRIHYVEKGAGDPVLFLHGNPTSSYLWRNVMPYVEPHARTIAMDLIGMGRSDKPALGYRFFDHYRYVAGFIEALGLENLTLVVHDWGSALGFHYAHRNPGNVRGIAFMEAILGPLRWADFPPDFRMGFKMFRTPGIGWLTISAGNAFVKQILPRAIVRRLSAEERAHYQAPYPTIGSRRPVRQWPREIPIEGRPRDVHEAVCGYRGWLTETEIPKLLLHATPGGLVRPATVAWARANLKKLDAVDIGPGIHFVQEDNPHGIGEAIAEWYGRTRGV